MTIANEQRNFKGLDEPILNLFDEGSELDKKGSTIVFDECYEDLEKNQMKE